MFCRWCGSTLKKAKPKVGMYCNLACRTESALALLEAMEGAEQATEAGLNAKFGSGHAGSGTPDFLSEIGSVVAEGGDDMVTRIAGRLAGAYGPSLIGKLREVVATHVGQARAEQAAHTHVAAAQAHPQPAWNPGWGAFPFPGSSQAPTQGRNGSAQKAPQPPPPKPQPQQPPPPPAPPKRPLTPKQRERQLLLVQLGLPVDATLEQAEARFKDLARTLHPDVAGGDGGPMKQLIQTRSRLRELMK